MQVVELDIAYFRAAYPQFADADAVPDAMLWSACGARPGSLWTTRRPPPFRPATPSGNPRKAILYALLCHLATLETRGDAVGRVGGATQGSVNMSLAWGQYTHQPAVVGADAMRRYSLGAFARLGHRAAVFSGVLTWRMRLRAPSGRC